MINWSFVVGFAFAGGFISGSVFNLLMINWLDHKMYRTRHQEPLPAQLLKELEKIINQKESSLKDLSLTIQNLNVVPQHKANNATSKNDPSRGKEHHFTLPPLRK